MLEVTGSPPTSEASEVSGPSRAGRANPVPTQVSRIFEAAVDDSTQEITRLLERLSSGRSGAWNELIPVVYEELRSLAREHMAQERRDHTLEPTALVHEAFLRLVGADRATFQNRRHFFGAATRAMERILVDHSRRRSARKRGGGQPGVPLESLTFDLAADPDANSSRLDAETIFGAIHRLEGLGAVNGSRKAEALRLRYVAGLTNQEIAALMDISIDTVKRDLRFARAWLQEYLGRHCGDGP